MLKGGALNIGAIISPCWGSSWGWGISLTLHNFFTNPVTSIGGTFCWACQQQHCLGYQCRKDKSQYMCEIHTKVHLVSSICMFLVTYKVHNMKTSMNTITFIYTFPCQNPIDHPISPFKVCSQVFNSTSRARHSQKCFDTPWPSQLSHLVFLWQHASIPWPATVKVTAPSH